MERGLAKGGRVLRLLCVGWSTSPTRSRACARVSEARAHICLGHARAREVNGATPVVNGATVGEAREGGEGGMHRRTGGRGGGREGRGRVHHSA